MAYPRRSERRKEKEGMSNPIAHTTMGELKLSPTNAKFWNKNILQIFKMFLNILPKKKRCLNSQYIQCMCICMNNILSTLRMHARACVLARVGKI